MQKQHILLIVGVVLALVAVVMIQVYIKQQQADIEKKAGDRIAEVQANQASVLVARADIPQGVEVQPDMLEAQIVPNDYVQPRAATSADLVAGKIALVPITKGEQITLTKLGYARPKQRAGGLAETTPVGKRAITILVDNIAAVGGMIKAGDYVDVMAIIPLPGQEPAKIASKNSIVPLFQNVLVLAMGRDLADGGEGRYAPPAPAKDTSPLITLALSPEEASLLAFVQEQGKIQLVLRSPSDSQVTPIQPVDWNTVMRRLYRKKSSAQEDEDAAQEAASKQPRGYVDIIRGQQKERVPLQ